MNDEIEWRSYVELRHDLVQVVAELRGLGNARYSIMVREYSSDHDVELLRVGSNPQSVVDGLKKENAEQG